MAHSSARVLADVFLARIPSTTERQLAIREISKGLHDHSTASLTAELLHSCPDDESETHLYEYLVGSLKLASDVESLCKAVDLCSLHPRVRSRILHEIEHNLDDAGALLSLRGVFKGYAIPTLVEIGTERQRLLQIDYDSTIELSVKFLSFLRTIYWSSVELPSTTQLVRSSLLLVGASHERLSCAARDALYAALTRLQNEPLPQSAAESLSLELWSRIISLSSVNSSQHYRSIAFNLWLRWTALPNGLRPTQSVLQDDRYWETLQSGLRTGASEQRKSCLHILRRSLSFVERDVITSHMVYKVGGLDATNRRKVLESQYERYCTLFETIVLGRYLNQVEECLGDLNFLASSKSKVGRTWLWSLLTPAFSVHMQDSLRKFVGTWLMNANVHSDSEVDELPEFLASSFLPWATQGHLFVSGIQKDGRQIRCIHGEQVSAFVKRLLEVRQSDGRGVHELTYPRTILTWIYDRGGALTPYAGAYLLEGLLKGLGDAESNKTLDDTDIDLVIKISSRTGLPEIARDLYTVLCVGLCQHWKHTSSILEALQSFRGYRALSERFHAIGLVDRSLTSDPGVAWALGPDRPSLEAAVAKIEESRYRCLRGSGLPAACNYLRHILDETDSFDGAEGGKLNIFIEALWSEVETQDYPKDALMLIPEVLLHPRCVRHCQTDSGLKHTLPSVFTKLLVLAENRIYVFSPLAAALRNAYLREPTTSASLPLDDFFVRLAKHPPSSKLEFLLESALSSMLSGCGSEFRHLTYGSYYGESESHGYACTVDLLNRLRETDVSVAKSTLDQLLSAWTEQQMPIPMVSKWKTTLQLQTMVVVSERYLRDATTDEVERFLSLYHKVLAIEPLPRYRYLLEWMIVRLYVHHAGKRKSLLEILSSIDHHSNPKYIASALKMAVMVGCLEDSTQEFALGLMALLIPLSASSKIIVRHEAQWMFPTLWDNAIKQGWTQLTDNPAFASLNAHIRNLERYSDPPPGRALEWMHPVEDHSLTNLFQGGYLQMDPPDAEVVTREDFEVLWHDDKDTDLLLPCLPLGDAPLRKGQVNHERVDGSFTQAPAAKSPEPEVRSATHVPLQTKGTAYLITLLSSSGPTQQRPSTDLIIIASLIDNAYNLGGLSRVSEIFAAASLHVAKRSVVKSKDFTSVAVSSENHIPIHELPPTSLPSFLVQKKLEGYTAVGVEQTDRSVILGSDRCVLPKKCVLVMGSEKEGIPAWVLKDMDFCVEVRQSGVTRSMNVQTAAAVVMFEYDRQHGGATR
ncbi:hypothetical protein B0A49_11615 [Cryomyces minteri]|uniref:tRNA/rRNA methyltransferase SpoU type domain-containing protein n=1 Tax=Cryomyces minteri TaxID=331657 RepID=A0A4U0WST7_9PEZI|nr:hypothetical protein B0A49_11615 [Cryomyces minteri]